MSVSLRSAYEIAVGCLKYGWKDENVRGYVKRMSIQKGDFVPNYEGKNPSSEPRIDYHFKGKIKLNKENVKKLNVLTRKFGLFFEQDSKKKTARIFEKRRIGKKTLMRISEKPERIIIDSPKTIVNSPVYYGTLLERVGEVFDIEA